MKFAAAAAQKMAADGLIVLLEGREATVNYIPSRCRYTLTMSDNIALGQRRAAQRIGAAAQAKVEEGSNVSDSNSDRLSVENFASMRRGGESSNGTKWPRDLRGQPPD